MNKASVIRDLERSRELLLPFFDAETALLRRTYAPGKWTAQQILGHLTDSETVFHMRVRFILSEPGCPIPPFDQDKWAKTLVYPLRKVPLMRRLFLANRESLMELADLLPAALFAREGKHPEFASYRAWDVLTRTTTHTMHHWGQLVAIRDETPWTPAAASPPEE